MCDDHDHCTACFEGENTRLNLIKEKGDCPCLEGYRE
jgi:hypothetical protein